MFGRAVLLFRTCLHPARPEMNINYLILQAIIMSFFQVSSGQLISKHLKARAAYSNNELQSGLYL